MCSVGTTGVIDDSWGESDISIIRGGFGAARYAGCCCCLLLGLGNGWAGIGVCFGGLGFVAVTVGGGIRACGCGCGSCKNPGDWFCHC
ncbi:uncharacterized protein LOC131874843 [Cryptomeria japonica]|uniref:uncharacterized protein LOC131874843 n=1 Tax=Cryptomeria japonica TaxID=3369 RepID=UPI0027D9ED02|nr:uncharacterized protein LOC131874843 [Cryptomeria japonica]